MDDDLNTSSALSVIFEIARPLKAISNRIERGDFIFLDPLENKRFYYSWLSLCEFTSVLGLSKELKIDSLNINENSVDFFLMNDVN